MPSRTICLTLCLLLCASGAGAQLPTGTISGRVTSADGLSLPGVTVTVTSPSLQGGRVVDTSENGDFSVPLLPPGDYSDGFWNYYFTARDAFRTEGARALTFR